MNYSTGILIRAELNKLKTKRSQKQKEIEILDKKIKELEESLKESDDE